MPSLVMITALMVVANAEQYQNDATQIFLENLNQSLTHHFLWSLLAFTAIVLVYGSAVRIYAHMRHLACLTTGGSQRYFAMASPAASWLKDHFLYAPLFHHRRATEIKFSRHFNLGSIPTRFQFTFIAAVIAVNIFACVYNIPWSNPALEVLPLLRNRTGTLSVGNLIPIVVMASIKNPLISLLDISYDTFNRMHRWLGRLSILQALAHTFCHVIAKVQSKGWAGMRQSVQQPFIYYGLIATIGFTILLLHTPKLVRSWAYEVFLHMHVIVVAVTFAFLWLHLKALPQLHLLVGAIVIWAVARGWRFFTLFYRSWGKENAHAAIEAMPGNALRITLKTPRPWTYRPGQSLYLTIPSVGWWTAHPFSIAWSAVDEPLSRSRSVKSTFDEKKPIARSRKIEIEDDGEPTYSLVVKAKTGLTKQLLDQVQRDGGVDGTQISFSALIEGPYGGERSMASYGTVMLFASGVGITHQMPYVRELVEGYNAGTVAARKVTLIWVIPSTDCLEWIRPWMHEILGTENRRDVLKVVLYITRAGLSQPIRSPSETVRMLRGRPDVETLMMKEAGEKMGCMGVSVCAGGGLADEVRRVSRILCAKGVNLDLIEEGFGW